MKEEEKNLEIETANRKNKGETKDEYERNEKSHIAEVTAQEATFASEITVLEEQLERNKKELINNYEQKLAALESELLLRMKVEIHEIEERKNLHINMLMLSHESSFREMKEYFNDITRENLDIIKQLNEKLHDIRGQITQSETVMATLKQNVTKLQEPLLNQKTKADQLRKIVVHMSNYIMSYRNAKGSLKELEARMVNIKAEKAKLDDKYKKVEQEKNDMYKKFEIAIRQLQSKSEYKNELLENKLAVFQRQLETKELTLRELVQRSGLD